MESRELTATSRQQIAEIERRQETEVSRRHIAERTLQGKTFQEKRGHKEDVTAHLQELAGVDRAHCC
jgi:hypothetical protein